MEKEFVQSSVTIIQTAVVTVSSSVIGQKYRNKIDFVSIVRTLSKTL